jgi:hypothetical protein
MKVTQPTQISTAYAIVVEGSHDKSVVRVRHDIIAWTMRHHPVLHRHILLLTF